MNNSLASSKTTHLPTNCLYLELFILFPSACSKQSKQYCRVFEQKRYLSIHLKPYGYTPQLYSTCAPRTLHVLRHTHTPYAHPMRTVHDSCAHRTRKPRAPYAHTARTVRTPRTHTPHAPYAHPARTHRTPRAHPFSYQNGRVQVKTLFSPFLDLAKSINYVHKISGSFSRYWNVCLFFLKIC